MIFLNILILIVGFVGLIKGADFFVDGSASLAKKFNISSLIIGLTIVAFGTSAPELAVSTTAALKHSNEIALSNVIGSNLFNTLCVLGMCALFHPVPSSSDLMKRDMPFSMIVTALVWLLGGGMAVFSIIRKGAEFGTQTVGTIGRLDAAVILVLFAGYMFFVVKSAINNPEEEGEEISDFSMKKCILLMIGGVIMIVVGGQAVVNAAKAIALSLGMSEALVGLTIIAVGTSLPELVTSMVAARKHETGLAVGNVIGSNLFNLMFILGTTAMISPVAVTAELAIHLVFLIGISLISYVFLLSKMELNRIEGMAMILIYAAQMAFAIR